MAGKIEVITGPMYCGKSDLLIRRAQRAQREGKLVLVFKPALDQRYGSGKIASHDRNEFPAIEVTTARGILQYLWDQELLLKVDVIGIDEAQFLDTGIVQVLSLLTTAITGTILVAGLDLDFRGEPFGSMPQIMTLADRVEKLTSVCAVCKKAATRSQRLTSATEVVQVGAQEAYEARCLHHFEPPLSPYEEALLDASKEMGVSREEMLNRLEQNLPDLLGAARTGGWAKAVTNIEKEAQE